MIVIRGCGVAAMLCAALLLQVVGLGASAVCPAAETAGAAEQMHPTDVADVHVGHRAAAEPAADGAPLAHDREQGDHAPTHCVMVMTCGAAGLVARATIADTALIGAAVVMAAIDDELPPSPGGAPEPPPPRG